MKILSTFLGGFMVMLGFFNLMVAITYACMGWWAWSLLAGLLALLSWGMSWFLAGYARG